MIIKENRNLVHYEGEIETSEFGIEFNSTLFNLLTDKIYSDKILAVQRELSNNSFDSHIEIGNNNPFDVKLPSKFDPVYIIRDYGTGLTPEQIKDIYTIVGKSNRNTSNKYNGCMGLGSKVFLGLGSRSAIVESFVNGKHWTYSVHLNERGIPCCSKLAEQNTQEPNGLKISVNIEPSEIANFVPAAEKLYPYFAIKPNFIGSVKPNIKPIKYVLSGNSWKVRDTSNDYYNRQCKAVQANIAYPIMFDDTGLDQKYRSLMNCPIDIFFDTGSLAIAPSREALSYDARTKTAIQVKFKEVLAELHDLVHDKIKSSKNLWEARINFIKIKDTIDQNILSVIGIENIEFNKKKLFDGYYSLNVPQDISMLQFEYRKYYSKNKTYKKDSHHIALSDATGWFYDDLKMGSHIRCRNALEMGTYPDIVLFNFKDGAGNQDAAQRQKLVDFLGCEDSMILPVSTLVKPTPVATIRSSKGSSTKVVQLKTGGDYRKSYCWDNTSKDLNDGGYYLEVNTFDIMDGMTKTIHPRNIISANTLLTELGETVPEVFGIKTAMIPKLTKTTNPWISYLTYLGDIVDKYNNKYNFEEIEKAIADFKCLGQYSYNTHSYNLDENDIKKIATHVTKPCVFLELRDEMLRLQAIIKQQEIFDRIKNLGDILGIPIKTVKTPYTKPALSTILSKVYKQYPLLSYCHNISNFKHVAEYIDLLS